MRLRFYNIRRKACVALLLLGMNCTMLYKGMEFYFYVG